VRVVESSRSIRQAIAHYEVSPSSAIELMQGLRKTGSAKPHPIAGTDGRFWSCTRICYVLRWIPGESA